VYFLLFVVSCDCHYQCNRLPGKIRLLNVLSGTLNYATRAPFIAFCNWCLYSTKLPFNHRWTTCECAYLVMPVYPICLLKHYCQRYLDLITLTCKLQLDILKMYLHTKSQLSRLRLSKVRVGYTHQHMTLDILPQLHLRVAKLSN